MLTEDFREIFGPILPIVPVGSVDEAYNIVRNRSVALSPSADIVAHPSHSPSSLVMYLFTDQRELRERCKDFHYPLP